MPEFRKTYPVLVDGNVVEDVRGVLEIEIIPDDLPSAYIHDRESLDFAFAELERGNVWAWCCVYVTVTIEHESGVKLGIGEDNLAGCTYSGVEDFMACPYYADMLSAAIEQLSDAWSSLGVHKLTLDLS